MRTHTQCASSVYSLNVAVLTIALQHENDHDIGVAVIDAFTHYVLEFMEGINKTSQTSMQDLVRALQYFAIIFALTKLFYSCSLIHMISTRSILMLAYDQIPFQDI